MWLLGLPAVNGSTVDGKQAAKKTFGPNFESEGNTDETHAFAAYSCDAAGSEYDLRSADDNGVRR